MRTLTLDVLLLRFGSGVVEITSAIFISLQAHVGFTIPLKRITLEVPAGNVPITKRPVHRLKVFPPSTENTANLRIFATLSIKITFSASAGPAFDTIIVKVKRLPTQTHLLFANFTTEMSASGTTTGLTGVSTVEVLLARFGSGVGELTIAVFTIAPVAVELTVPLIMIVLTWFGANVPKLKLPVHGAKVTPPSTENSGLRIEDGILSVRSTLSAAFGPKFVTVIV
jgi:hypothetical protein